MTPHPPSPSIFGLHVGVGTQSRHSNFISGLMIKHPPGVGDGGVFVKPPSPGGVSVGSSVGIFGVGVGLSSFGGRQTLVPDWIVAADS